MNVTFTYEENSLEKLFVEEYKLQMPDTDQDKL